MSPNYNRAVRESINVLMDFDFKTIPIDLDIIFKKLKRTVSKISYSEFAKKRNMSMEEVYEYLESDLGACAYSRTREKYVVFYNDTQANKALDRFTIAHELGHMFLNHYDEVDDDILLRKGVSEAKYKNLENEANCFARNLLSPVPLVEKIIDLDTGFSIGEIQEAFGIGMLASHTRRDLLPLDSYRIYQNDYNYFNTYEISFGHNCMYCGNTDIKNLEFCKICGRKHSDFIKTHGTSFSDEIETNKDGRVIKCPVCDNEDFTEGLYYCKICGTERYNYCSDYDNCGQINEGNARYCKYCGSTTVYLNKNLLDEIKTGGIL